MKTKYIYIWFIAAFALLSCQKEPVIKIAESESTSLTLTGYANDALTKTYIGGESGGNVNFKWRVGDNLGLNIYKEGSIVSWGNNIVALVSKKDLEGPGFSFGTFKTTLGSLDPSTNYDVKIYYPYYEFIGGTAGQIAHYIPAVQTQSQESNSEHIGLSGSFGYATAAFTTPATVTGYTPEITFTLEHKTSYIWLNLSAQAGGFEGWKVKSITIKTPEGKYISGETLYNTATGDFSINPSGNKYNYITLNTPAGMTLSSVGNVSAYFVTAPVALAGETVTFTYILEKSDGTETKTITHDRVIHSTSESLKSGGTHRFAEIIPTTSGAGWTISAPAATLDLNTQGYANCYIVSTPGNYSFDATVIGNGEEGLLGLPSSTTQFHTESVTISPVSAELVWQTSTSLITSVTLSGGKVTFTKNGATKGNALIAVKNAGGDIIWSWHIWCADVGVPQTYINADGYSFNVMDRNLGAKSGFTAVPANQTEFDESISLHYEFGRKDPFIGLATLLVSSGWAPLYDGNNDVYSPPSPILTSASVGTIEYTIANPTRYIYKADGNYDWFAGKEGANTRLTRGFYLWGNPYGYWHNAGITGTGENGYSPTTPTTPQKSIYDPCPAGWMVAPRNTFTGLNISNCTDVNAKGKIVYYQSEDKSGDATWFPYGGRYNHLNGTVTNRTLNSWIWSSSFRNGATSVVTLFSMVIGSVVPTNNYYATYGANIRCVQQY